MAGASLRFADAIAIEAPGREGVDSRRPGRARVGALVAAALLAGVALVAKPRSRARGGVHRLRVLCGLAPVACGVLLMLAALPPEALASTNWSTGVEAPLPANARTIQNGALGLVSCASAGNCTAVGGYTDSSGYPQGLLLTETSGTWETGVEASLPANADTHLDDFLGSLSCASPGNCSAVGFYTDSSGHQQGLLLTETSGRWATGVEASLPANAGREPDPFFNELSCASPGNCTAVGLYGDSSAPVHSLGLLLTETSGTWATGVEASLPANAGTNPDPSLWVSCASAGSCTAVGYYRDTSGRDEGLLLTETSGTWAAGVEPSLPANAGANPDAQVESVSCASAGNCTAVGDYDFGGTSSRGLLLTETSGTWATGVEASEPANAGTTHDASVISVSCASAGNCTAVGYYRPSKGTTGLLLTETSGSALALIGSPTSNAARVTDKLICAPSALGPCQATEMLTTTETIQGGRPVALSASTRRKRRTVIVATKMVMIRPGRTVTVTVKLNATGRELLARFGKLPVILTIRLLQNGRHLAIANTNTKLTVKPKKK